MRRITLGVAMLLIVAGSGGAEAAADRHSVQFLHDACKREMTAKAPGFCLGFVEGVGQTMQYDDYEIDPTGGPLICFPDNRIPSAEALIRAFMMWADDHPEHRASPAHAGVVEAFTKMWGCPRRY